MHELFGQMLLRADHPHRAAEQCAVALRRHPNRARALLGGAWAHTQTGDTQATANAYTQCRQQWRSADGQLEEVREARAYGQQASAR